MRRISAIFAALIVVVGCATTTYTRSTAPELFAALDTQADGWVGTSSQSERFQILETRTNGELLCRRVMVQGASTTRKEFCKIKGGEWR